MQCYFWDVDCVAHNSCVLHLVGVMNDLMNEIMDDTKDLRVASMHCKLGWASHKKGSQSNTKASRELTRKEEPQDQFFFFFFCLILYLFSYW